MAWKPHGLIGFLDAVQRIVTAASCSVYEARKLLVRAFSAGYSRVTAIKPSQAVPSEIERLPVSWTPTLRCFRDGNASVAAAIHGVSLIMIGDCLVDDHLRQDHLVRILQEVEMPPMPAGIVYVPSRHPSPAARAFIDRPRRGMRNHSLSTAASCLIRQLGQSRLCSI